MYALNKSFLNKYELQEYASELFKHPIPLILFIICRKPNSNKRELLKDYNDNSNNKLNINELEQSLDTLIDADFIKEVL